VLEGRWRFVTGSPAADHLVVGNLVDGGTNRPPRLCYALFPADRAELVDTWHVDGLRGTGSGDVVAHDLFVPEAWTGVIHSPLDTVPDAILYRLPSTLRFPIPKTAVAAGIARGAIDDLTALAGAKTPVSARSELRERPDAARAVAEATALRASGWAWVREVAEELWGLAATGGRIPRDVHARARLAASSSVRCSVRAVELVCSAAGSTANFADSPLSRRFRDVHAVPQHFTVAPYQLQTAGRVLLGLPADDPTF
jgi:alkylation response protein AidB-like acyl-CoA dehydrogenase